MSIWGKLVGGAAGFALGGPVGAILGGAAGHVIDRAFGATRRVGAPDTETKQTAFAVAVIVLAAKMAKADGRVTRNEIAAFKRLFPIPDAHVSEVGRIWNTAAREATGFEPYARQIVDLFPHNESVRQELIGVLVRIAMADGEFHEQERAWLARVAAIFGFDERAFARIVASHADDGEADPYEVLGVGPEASNDEIRKTWRRLSREYHPDRMIAQGMPEEMIEVANTRMAAINAAYDRIAQMRGLR